MNRAGLIVYVMVLRCVAAVTGLSGWWMTRRMADVFSKTRIKTAHIQARTRTAFFKNSIFAALRIYHSPPSFDAPSADMYLGKYIIKRSPQAPPGAKMEIERRPVYGAPIDCGRGAPKALKNTPQR